MTQRMTPALGTSAAPTVTAFVLFLSLVLWILALRSDIHFSYSSHLPSGPSNIQSHTVLPPKPVHTYHLYPAIPLSRHAHTHIIQHTPRMRRYSLHSYFFHPTVSQSHPSSSRSVLHSLFPVRFDRFALIIVFFCFLALFCLSFLSALAFVISSICALSSFSRHIALLDSHYLE